MCHVAFGANCLVTGRVKSLPRSIFRHSHRVSTAVIGAFKILDSNYSLLSSVVIYHISAGGYQPTFEPPEHIM